MKNSLTIFIGILFMFSACVKNKGSITMTYNKATAVYGDIDALRNTPLVSTSRNIENSGKIFVGDDFLLIGEKGEGIHVFDNSNTSAPVPVVFINLPYTEEFFVDGDIIYAESHYDFLKINIADIYNPKLMDRVSYAFGKAIENDKGDVLLGFSYEVVTESFELNSPEAEALAESNYLYYNYMNELIPQSSVPSSFAGSGSEIKGTLNKIAVHNNYIYVIGSSTIYTFRDDMSDVTFIGESEIGNEMETIYSENNNLFIGTKFSMIIASISNPSNPTYISEYNHPTSCDPVYPNGNYAYVTLRTADFSGCAGDENTLVVLDIANVSSPIEIDQITMDSPYGMALIGDRLFVGEGSNGLKIFDAYNPGALSVLSSNTSVLAYDVIAHPTLPNVILTTGDGGLQQYEIDYSDMSMQLVSSISY